MLLIEITAAEERAGCRPACAAAASMHLGQGSSESGAWQVLESPLAESEDARAAACPQSVDYW